MIEKFYTLGVDSDIKMIDLAKAASLVGADLRMDEGGLRMVKRRRKRKIKFDVSEAASILQGEPPF